MSQSDEVIARMIEALGAENDSDLARMLGTKPSTVGSWRSRDSIPYAECVKLSRRTGLSIDWLITGETERMRLVKNDIERAGIPHEVFGDSLTPPMLDFVPFYDVAVAAGHGREVLADDAKPSAYNAYRKSWLDSRGLSAKQLIELPVVGDSMEDELRSGDTVLVDTSVREIRGGSIYVLRQGDDLIVKYLQQLPGDDVMVTSANSAAYPPYTIRSHYFETGEAEIIGRVVRQGRDR